MHGAPAWSLTTFRRDGGSTDEAGIVLADGRIVQPDCLAGYPGLIAAMGDWAGLAPKLQSLAIAGLPAIAGAEMLVPLRFPNKLICSGANYHAHMAEMGSPTIPEGCAPFFFFVPPTTTLVATQTIIDIPADAAACIDWEAELAVIIGRRATRISREEARDCVAGYAGFNDITARGYLYRARSLAPPFAFDWAGSKGLDGFCPIGPITPAWMIPDPENLSIRCTVDGTLKQNGNTGAMIVDIWDLISAASHSWTLEPGDILATGTPAGVGAAAKTFLHGGEEIVVEIDGCAPLRNVLRLRTDAPAMATMAN